MTTVTEEDRFGLEVLKLLAQLAWVDGKVEQRERLVVQGLGRSWSVPEKDLQALLDALQAGHPPEPDLALLRPRGDEVLEAARALVAAEGRVAEEEQRLLADLQRKLGTA